MLKPLLIFLFISILFLSPLFAQTDFRPGYIVTQNSDTLRGFIDNRTETKNARQVGFKTTQAGEAVKYDPATIIAYGLTGDKMYEAKTITLDSTTTEIAFVELLVKGKISLYHFKEDGRLYLEKEAKPLHALYQTDIKVYRNGLPYIQTRKDYIGALQWYMADCPQVQKKIDQAKLDYLSLMKLVEAYNHCGQEYKSVKTKRKFIVFRPGITGGLQSNTIGFSTKYAKIEYLNHARFGYSQQPFGALFVKTNFPWLTTKVSLYVEAQYSKVHYYSDYEWSFANSSVTFKEELEYNTTNLRLPLLLRYTFPKGKIRPFIQAGGTFDFLLSQSGYYVSEHERFNVVDTYEPTPAALEKSLLYGTLGTGIELHLSKKVWGFIEIRGSHGTAIAETESMSSTKTKAKMLSLQAGIGF